MLTSLVSLSLASYTAFAAGGSAAWQMTDRENALVGSCGFSLTPEGSGYRFVSGSYSEDSAGGESWERLEALVDRDLKILSLRFEAVQDGAPILTEGKLEKGQLHLSQREGKLPARHLSIPADTAAREIGLLRVLASATAGSGEDAVSHQFEPMDLSTFVSRIRSEKTGREGDYRLRVRNARRGGAEEASSYHVVCRDRKSLNFSVSRFEGDPQLQFRQVSWAEFERRLDSLAAGARDLAQALPPTFRQVNEILEASLFGSEAERGLLVAKLADLGPELIPVVNSYRGEKLQPGQKVILGLALAALEAPEARESFLGWLESLGSYERLLTVRGLAAGKARNAVGPLLEILQRPELGLEREAKKTLDLLGDRLGQGELRKALLAALNEQKAAPRAGALLPLLRFASERKLPVPAPLWLAAIEKSAKEETARLLSLVGRETVEWDPETQEALVERVESMLRDASLPAMQAEAAAALGRLRQMSSVPLLVESLEEEATASSAHLALQEITQLRFPPDSKRWRRWWEEEQTRLERELPLVLDKLQRESKEEKLAAISRLTFFTLGREEIVPALENCLQDPEKEVRDAAQRILQTWNHEKL